MILFISPKFGARPDSTKLINAAHARGIHTYTFLNNWNGHSSFFKTGDIGALYGEHAFCDFAAQELRWNLYQNSLDWISKLPHAFIKRSIKYMTMEEVIDLENAQQSVLDARILEPADEPCFPAQVYPARFPRVPLNTPVLVSTNCKWKVKYRYIIANNRIVTSCCYLVDTVFNEPVIWQMKYNENDTTADEFIKTLLNHVNCAPGCVVDVGIIEGAGWAICGTYPIWSSELYGCDPKGFLEALFAACKQEN